MDLLDKLNDKQKEAVLTTEGPLLILAGAGSGKTRTIIHRMAYIVEKGLAWPSQILAITFTNKAAGEMRERIAAMNIRESDRMWISTFHAMCARMMRMHGEWLGYDKNFVIYDTDDQKRLFKQLGKAMAFDEKQFPFSMVMGRISDAKDAFLSPKEYAAQVDEHDFKGQRIAAFYEAYQKELVSNNAMDFDDLLFNTVRLFQENPAILQQYQQRFKYILVDEYQDTNHAQYLLVEMLSQTHQNLCVCGDDDQSIYGWRGADITNILDFEKSFPNAKVIKLEQNYRSTQTILEVANKVIAHNQGRKSKVLWTENQGNEKLMLSVYDSGHAEAEETAKKIIALKKEGYSYGDCAVLYRTNVQSRLFEEAFMRHGIPYQLVGGTGFYARQEIKDIVTYLQVLVNPKDDLGCLRIINMPRRGIGNAALEKIREYADFKGMSLMEGVYHCDEIPVMSSAMRKKINDFAKIMKDLQTCMERDTLPELIRQVIVLSGYEEILLQNKLDNSESRLENLQELVSSAVAFEEISDDKSISAFLETVALSSDTDQMEEKDSGKVLLMTLHSAKGLEFPVVFMPGMENGFFPTQRALFEESQEGIEEERRICYVGITRAKERLFMSRAKVRILYGNTEYRLPSVFLDELPEDLLDSEEQTESLTFSDHTFDIGSYEKTEKIPELGRNRYLYGSDSTRNMSRSMAASALRKTKPEEKSDDGMTVSFSEGDKVSHKKFGMGTIVQMDGDIISVAFPGMGIKKLKTAFVEKV